MRRREAFTLIEMLIVIAVIGILAGISFKMMQIANRTATKGQTISKLEKVAHALNEYRSEYGAYPPVMTVTYEYENESNQTDWLRENYFMAYGDTKGNILFDMGLVAYLEPRGGAYHDQPNVIAWIPDTPRDLLGKARWSEFLIGIVESGAQREYSVDEQDYANDTRTILDSWGNEIHYECLPPYLSYRLWSDGPTSAPEDDLHRDRWDN